MEHKQQNLFAKDGIKKNKFTEIFRDDLAYTLFLRFHEEFKKSEKNTDLADYSFIFYALQSDEMILVRGSTFIEFLGEEFDIHIDKIDSRKSGNTRRTTSYNFVKATLTKISQSD